MSLRRISLAKGPTRILHDVDLDVCAGELMVVVGPSGCGKSTLLRLVAGLERPSSGEIWIAGRRVDGLRPVERRVAMVFQSYALYPHMTVGQNMAFGLRLEGRTRDAVDARVRESASLLRIEELLDRKPASLSGGQRQRVAIGRAIVRSPDVFLFDEPLSNLDASLRGDMRLELARLHRELGATTLYVTHDQLEAMTLGSRIVVMRAGRVEQVGVPLEVYHAPRNRFVAEFIGSPRMNVVPGRIVSRSPGRATVDLAGVRLEVGLDDTGLGDGAAVDVGVRPERVALEPRSGLAGSGAASSRACLPGEVQAVEHLGNMSLVHASTEAGLVAAMTGADAPWRIGDGVSVCLAAGDCHLFRADGVRVPPSDERSSGPPTSAPRPSAGG
ncbi:MAG: ABC transporter ATP-binding protein [Vicinamibacterales bacterium]